MRKLVILIALLGCSASDERRPREPRGAWLFDRGRASENWAVCLRIASALRAECGGDAACERDVTERFSFHCYAGSYDSKARRSPCADNVPMTCDEASVSAALRGHCFAELAYLANEVCRRGGVTLTGAGP